jgi:hypothetical protein
MRALPLTPRERERKLAVLRKIQRDPNTSALMRLAALREINKLMGLRPK